MGKLESGEGQQTENIISYEEFLKRREDKRVRVEGPESKWVGKETYEDDIENLLEVKISTALRRLELLMSAHYLKKIDLKQKELEELAELGKRLDVACKRILFGHSGLNDKKMISIIHCDCDYIDYTFKRVQEIFEVDLERNVKN